MTLKILGALLRGVERLESMAPALQLLRWHWGGDVQAGEKLLL